MTAIQRVFDPIAFKETTRNQWDVAAEAWNRWSPLLSRWLGPATEMMLDMTGVQKGSRVLDVAAGAGEQTLAAARRVGPAGYVLASDLSPGILAFAAQNARLAGFENVETVVKDGEDLSEIDAKPFDAVISRVGLIYFPDQNKALTGMRAQLRPSGRVGAITYAGADLNGFFLGPSEHHSATRGPSCSVARTARPVQLGRSRCSCQMPGRRRIQRYSHRACQRPSPLRIRPLNACSLNRSPLAPCTRCSVACPSKSRTMPGSRLKKRLVHLKRTAGSRVPAKCLSPRPPGKNGAARAAPCQSSRTWSRTMVNVAVVQEPPVYLDLEKSTQRAIDLVAQSAKRGCGMVVFPEAWLPGYPTFVWRLTPGSGMSTTDELYARLLANSVDLAKGGLAPLQEVARERGIVIVIGYQEVDGSASGGTIFNSCAIIDADGRLANNHRKLKPDESRANGLGFWRRIGLERGGYRCGSGRHADLLGKLHASGPLRALCAGHRHICRADLG